MRVSLSGGRYGRWTVGAMDPARSVKMTFFWCVCDCGTRRSVCGSSLTRGASTSCGCLKNERTAARNVAAAKHHESGAHITPEYRIWKGIRDRCYNGNSKDYSRYGGRGIVMCASWGDSFEAFLADMGRRPSPRHSIDRVDVNGSYSPANCRWATASQQGNNKRNNVLIAHMGTTKTVAQWSRQLGVNAATIWARHKRGLSPEQIFAGAIAP